jgi:hypothetical protein
VVRHRYPADLDPFAVLGLQPDADADAVRGARRRLAMALHPDRGGDVEHMRAVNAAFEEAMARLGGQSSEVTAPATATSATTGAGTSDPARSATVTGRHAPRGESGRRWVERDEPSFVVEALPVEAFEALLIVANWMGEVLVDDPPYLLEAHLDDPGDCWCRLELLPEAGATTVMLTVAGIEGRGPSVEAVRDRFVANLNLLGPAEEGA